MTTDIKQARNGHLTPRQLAILNLMKLGMSDKAIALELGVTPGAVANRISHGVLPRLGAVNRAHAVYLGMKLGFVS
ncbi:hypothetical protein LCGC14_2665940 [marine sediment metagenome]|uniref:HTH luxR-type domain-containing protein n=1 Tax=marine sediment metagenome TaxID=412755 RepID=A0A0F8ZQM2_9ZZZZ